MYILPPVHELTIVGVFDAGVPNKERVVLRPTETLNLAAFALVLSTVADGGVLPLADQFFWFGEKWVTPPAWIVVYTGPGQYRESAYQGTGEPVLELHWGRSTVVLNLPDIALSLVRIGAITSQIDLAQAHKALPPKRTTGGG
ncbi:MAG: hypothetical protein HOP28_07675 [Gemmatimonadales bacterium]|nr:hypothetical protein [Gemmatimonadales bacterium]